MNLYKVCIKSHCEAPDFEAEVKANSISEAINEFMKMSKGELDEQLIANNIEVIEDNTVSKLRILNAQIQTDYRSLLEDIECGTKYELLGVNDHITQSLEKINKKLALWAKEADKIIEESKKHGKNSH